MNKSTYSMSQLKNHNSHTTYCVFLSYYNTHLVISIQSTTFNHEVFLILTLISTVFLPIKLLFNQLLKTTKNTRKPYLCLKVSSMLSDNDCQFSMFILYFSIFQVAKTPVKSTFSNPFLAFYLSLIVTRPV